MMKKGFMKGSAVALALMLACSPVAVPHVEAAVAVNTESTCQIDFSIAGEYMELKSVEGGVPITLYKVATIDGDGSYHAVAPFTGIDLSALPAGSSDEWQKRAADADQLIGSADVAASTSTDSDARASISGLATGLYLVEAGEVQSGQYTYSFTPYLISLPNNYYEQSGDDTWIYELTGENALSLKAGQTARFGQLQIDKSLINQNLTEGMSHQATFVFQVDIVTPQGKEIHDTLALTFDQIGTKQSLITQIPAGSTVTVTESYSGAGYKLTAASNQTQTVTIVADETAVVRFENEVDGTLNGGYGVINNFSLNAIDENNFEYVWDNTLTDNTETVM